MTPFTAISGDAKMSFERRSTPSPPTHDARVPDRFGNGADPFRDDADRLVSAAGAFGNRETGFISSPEAFVDGGTSLVSLTHDVGSGRNPLHHRGFCFVRRCRSFGGGCRRFGPGWGSFRCGCRRLAQRRRNLRTR